ncbi:MAG: glycerate kinase [Bacteroidota bacterium]
MRERKTILLAPDSFKGTLSAVQAARAMRAGVEEALPDATILVHPVSDGGEGLVEVVVAALGGEVLQLEVSGPLPGQIVEASFGLSGDGTAAIIEMAQAAGLHLVPPGLRDPKVTSTVGVGDLIRAALERGVSSILVGIGGSATNDGGAGMAEALGIRLLDGKGTTLPRGGAALEKLGRIDFSGRDRRLEDVSVTVACDAQNPLLGPSGASRVYGPQKGATPADVELLERSLSRLAEVVHSTMGLDLGTIPGGGAAGGLGAGLIAFCNARLRKGIDVVLDMTGFDALLQTADLVITGEGKIDAQLRFGKALSGVLDRAVRMQKPVAAVVGSIEGPKDRFLGSEGFKEIFSLVDETTSQEEAMASPARYLQNRTREMLKRLGLV